MSYSDYYQVLGVTYTATDAEVRKSYKKLCLKYHPDKTGGDGEAHQKFLKVKEAYETLSEPSKKAAYDRTIPSKVNIFTHKPHQGASSLSNNYTTSSTRSSGTGSSGSRASDGYFLFYQNYFQQQNETTRRARDFRRQWEFDSKRREEEKRQTEELLRRQREEEIRRYQEEVRRTQRRTEELKREKERQEELRRELEEIRRQEERHKQKLKEQDEYADFANVAFETDEFGNLSSSMGDHTTNGFGFKFDFDETDISFEGDSEDNPIVVDDDDDETSSTLGSTTPTQRAQQFPKEEAYTEDDDEYNSNGEEEDDEQEDDNDIHGESVDSDEAEQDFVDASFASESAKPNFVTPDDTEQDSDVFEIKPEPSTTKKHKTSSSKRQKRDDKLFSFEAAGKTFSAKRQKIDPFSTADLKKNLASGIDEVDFSDLQGSLPNETPQIRQRNVLMNSESPRYKKPKLAEFSDGTTKAETLHTPVNKRSFMTNHSKTVNQGTQVRQLTALDLHASATIHNFKAPTPPDSLLHDPERLPRDWGKYVSEVANYQRLWFEYQEYVLQYQEERHRKDKEFMEEINSSTSNFSLYLECLRQDTVVQERYLALLREHGHFMNVYKLNCSWMKATRRSKR